MKKTRLSVLCIQNSGIHDVAIHGKGPVFEVPIVTSVMSPGIFYSVVKEETTPNEHAGQCSNQSSQNIIHRIHNKWIVFITLISSESLLTSEYEKNKMYLQN